MSRLTKRQELFAKEYVVDMNGESAAERAGYSRAGAKVAAYRLLKKPQVKAEVDRLVALRGQGQEAAAARWRKEVEAIAYSDAGALYGPGGQLVDVPSLPESERRAVAGLEVAVGGEEGPPLDDGAPRQARPKLLKLKRWDKVKALELLGKHLGLLVDRQRHEGADGGPLVVEIRKESP